MKKAMSFVLVALAITLIMSGCSSGGGDTAITAPVMPAASTLPASEATMPASDEEAIDLYNEAQLAMQATAPVGADESAASLPARATQDLYKKIPCGDGWITYTGTLTDSTSESASSLTTVQTYNVNGVIDDATVYVNGIDGAYYTINGTTSDKSRMTMKMSINARGSEIPVKLDFAIKMASGASLSFKRSSDGKGGKFIISYATDFNGSFDDMVEALDPEAYDGFYANTDIVIEVYNDANEKIRTINTTLDKLTVTALPETEPVFD